MPAKIDVKDIGIPSDANARTLALLYAFWAMAEALLHDDVLDREEFFGRAAAGLKLLKMTGNFKAAEELVGIIDPIASVYFDGARSDSMETRRS